MSGKRHTFSARSSRKNYGMSKCIRHEPCPKCGPQADGAGDNLGVYDDGHKWCFACGYYVASSGIVSIADLRARLNSRQSSLQGLPVQLPSDYTCILPSIALDWLRKYGLTDDELNQNHVGWSESYHRIIFPVYDESRNLLMWQGRLCLTPAKIAPQRSKYFTEGSVEEAFAIYGRQSALPVCVVEDVVSAIKVGRTMAALCLWGSELSLRRIRVLSKMYENLFIWLDWDKAHHAAKCALKARPYFTTVSGIYTQKDPKEYSTEEITQWIHPVSK